MTTQQQPWALENLRVLDLTSYLSQNCARALGDLGADVIKVEPPGGDPARNMPPFAGDIQDPERSLRFIHANRSKRSVVLDINVSEDRAKIRALAERSDVLVEDFAPGYLASLGLGYEDLKAVNPGLVYVSITPFGQTGPHSSYLGGDLIAQASAGVIFANGDDLASPVRAPYELAAQMASLQGALGALLAIRSRRAIGHGQHVDASRQEAMLWAQNSYISRYSYQDQITRREGHHSAFGAVNTYHTRDDGYVNLSIYMTSHFGRMAKDLMDHPVLSDEMWWEREIRQENREVVDNFVQEYMDTVDRDDVVKRGQEIGIPIVPVLSPAEYAESDHAKERDFFIEMEHPVIGTYRTAGPPFRMSASPWRPKRSAPLLGEHTEEVLKELESLPAVRSAQSNGHGGQSGLPRPLDGIRIADFTRAFAGPISTMYMGFFGAEVIKVESEDLDDNRTPGQSTFQDLNRAKLSCTLDLRKPQGKDLLKDLVRQSDIVSENFRPTVMDRLDIGYDELRQVKPDLIMIAMPGMGDSGPLSSYFCYGQQIMGIAGLTYLWGHADGAMDTRIKMPFADYVAALFGAIAMTAALEYRDRTGEGQYIELAQVEGAAHLLSVGYMDYLINGRAPEPVGNRSDIYAPHDVYPCIGFDAWCAIEVQSEEQWQALFEALDSPAWARDERFGTLEGRIANKEELDRNIGEWTKQFSPRQAMRILQRAGVPASYVATAEDLFVDPHLRSRPGVVSESNHLDSGPMEHQGINVILSDTPGDASQAAPIKGQHNEYVYKELLKLDPARQRELEESGALS